MPPPRYTYVFHCKICRSPLHHAKGLCRKCFDHEYLAEYYRVYMKKYRQHPWYKEQRKQYDIAYQLKYEEKQT